MPADWFATSEPTIFVALLDASLWQPWRDEAALLLDAAETARVGRRRVPDDREMLTIAYAIHRLLLGSMLGCEPQDVPVYRDVRGCPRLANDLISTSLSHADGLVALAMSRVGPLGVDIERAGRGREMPLIAQRICHRADAAALTGMDVGARNQALLELWVRKEAALKAAGVGFAVEMDEFPAPGDGAVEVPLSSLPARCSSMWVQMLDAGVGSVAAIAAPPGIPIECKWLQP